MEGASAGDIVEIRGGGYLVYSQLDDMVGFTILLAGYYDYVRLLLPGGYLLG